MITDFPTAPLAPGLREAGGSTVEKSLSASHTEILTLPVTIAHETCKRSNRLIDADALGSDAMTSCHEVLIPVYPISRALVASFQDTTRVTPEPAR